MPFVGKEVALDAGGSHPQAARPVVARDVGWNHDEKTNSWVKSGKRKGLAAAASANPSFAMIAGPATTCRQNHL